MAEFWTNSLRRQAELLSNSILPGLPVNISTIYLLPVVAVAM